MFVSIKIENKMLVGLQWEWGDTRFPLDTLEKRLHHLCLCELDHREKINTDMKLYI